MTNKVGIQQFITRHFVYCPVCDIWFPSSPYLNEQFSDDRQRWLANMVTHSRHKHVNYYNQWIGYASRRGNYEAFKHQVNERAKRNILRKCKKFIKSHGFTLQDVLALRGRDEKTLKLAVKVLGGTLEGIDLTEPPEAADAPETLENRPRGPVQAKLEGFE